MQLSMQNADLRCSSVTTRIARTNERNETNKRTYDTRKNKTISNEADGLDELRRYANGMEYHMCNRQKRNKSVNMCNEMRR